MSKRMFFFVSVLLFVSHSEAYAFTVSPLRLFVNSDNRTDVIRVHNPRNIPVTFTVKVFAWPESSQIVNLSPSNDLLVIPPIFEVKPNKSQLIRIAARTNLDRNRGHSYRLLITEVPSEVNTIEGVKLNYRISMPVFFRALGAKPDPIWRIEEDRNMSASLVLSNPSETYLFLNSVSLSEDPDVPPIFEANSGGPVFPGERRTWPLNIESELLAQPLVLKAETNIGPIEALVSLPRD